MAINAMSYIANNYCCSGNALISEETRRKLIALGIDPSTVTSEAQARALIEKAEKAREAKQKEENKKLNPEQYEYLNKQNNENIKAVIMTMEYGANINRMILGL